MRKYCPHCGAFVVRKGYCSDMCRRRHELKKKALKGPTVMDLVATHRRARLYARLEEYLEDWEGELDCPGDCTKSTPGGGPLGPCGNDYCPGYEGELVPELIEERRRELRALPTEELEKFLKENLESES